MCKKPYEFPKNHRPFPDTTEWEKEREKIKAFYENEVFGKIDEDCRSLFSFEKRKEEKLSSAVKKTIYIQSGDFSAPFYLYLPDGMKNPSLLIHPVLHSYEGVFDLNNPDNYYTGKNHSSFPIGYLLQKGYAVACYYVCDVALDQKGGENSKIMPYLVKNRQNNSAGVLRGWAYFSTLIIDYVSENEEINHEKIGICGHSRGGKTALLAGAFDERITFVLSNNAGCSGNALAIQNYGETIADITRNFPYWFCKNYLAFAQNEEKLPYDFDALLSLIAPRLLYVTSSSKDKWACPKNEYLSCLSASNTYLFYNQKGLIAPNPPRINHPYQDGLLAYHIKKGKHSLAFYDWQEAVTFLHKNNF